MRIIAKRTLRQFWETHPRGAEARINYAYRIVYVRFVGTHEEYDSIDVEPI